MQVKKIKYLSPFMELPVKNKQFYYRLIALWAVCEGTLGGIIHGFQLPITGLIVGSSAVIIICLIGYYIREKGAILRATILVCIFKLMLSPHSPIGAYYAVLFQGVLGELFFFNKKYYKTSCIVFATLALAESGAQGIIVPTLIYGMDFWKAVNKFISNLTNQENVTNYSLYIGAGYLFLHILVGFTIGIIASRIPSSVPNWKNEFSLKENQVNNTVSYAKPKENSRKNSPKRIGRSGLFVIWIILSLVWLQAVLHIGNPILVPDEVLHILMRSFLIILTWYFLIGPLLLKLLKRWLEKQKTKFQGSISEILLLIPSTNSLVTSSWNYTENKRGLKRLSVFFKIVMVNALLPE